MGCQVVWLQHSFSNLMSWCDEHIKMSALQDTLIMAGTAFGGILNGILLAQSWHTARKDAQADTDGLEPQPA